MRNFGIFVLICIVPVMLTNACSVKDDRAGCPSVLELDLNEVDPSLCKCLEVLILSEDGFRCADTLDLTSAVMTYDVPKTDLYVRAWYGDEGMMTDYGLTIPYGEACPRVFMYDKEVAVSAERHREVVRMKKNHCVLTLTLEGSGLSGADIYIEGNVAGYDTKGKPLEGDFSVPLARGSNETEYVVVIPRQLDQSLRLLIDDGDGTYKSFALGQYISSSGYDWTLPDLDDIAVTIDYALTEVSVVKNDWESVFKYDVEI